MPDAKVLSPGEQVAQRTITTYTLTPAQMVKSEGLYRTGIVLSFAYPALELAIVAAILWTRFGSRLQRLAERASRNRFVQACIFVPLLLLLFNLLELPLEIYSHHLSRAYGLSVQGWGSWLWDQAKSMAISIPMMTLCLWGIYAAIRKTRRWWLWGWFVGVPLMAFIVFLSPVLLDPVFNRFDSLKATNPELTTQLQSLARSSGLNIPESRIYLMHASDKVTTYNAYVTGFGATKRIVVWDTTARDMTVPQTLFIFGHEMGHYVMHHIYIGMALSAVGMFVGLWLVSVLVPWMIQRQGARWGVASLGDWASLPLLIGVVTVLSFVSAPLDSTISRQLEHAADAYGLQVTLPVTPNARQVAAQSFQLLGEKSYSYPEPARLYVVWHYSHPPIAERIHFVLGEEK
jgi:Zn-dependent protease with chaperone function